MGLVARIEEGPARRSFRLTIPPSDNVTPIAGLPSSEPYEAKVFASLKLVDRTAKLFEDLQAKLLTYEDEIAVLQGHVGGLNGKNEQMSAELYKAAEMIRAEYDRATNAEARANASETRVGELQDETKTLSSQLDRLLTALSQSFP